jgi:hypothetical protein
MQIVTMQLHLSLDVLFVICEIFEQPVSIPVIISTVVVFIGSCQPGQKEAFNILMTILISIFIIIKFIPSFVKKND